ncbi:hypothetical protein C5167_000648 [Papaver somniferum]|uniref:Protein kinase domain-containing protein n=1 Tax=Papaver somniferum TaxID=3469 RepID=A0A4Y7KXA7_PAPSO|nr:hypothetical protein C5167_000648 [Papaver somniferum]
MPSNTNLNRLTLIKGTLDAKKESLKDAATKNFKTQCLVGEGGFGRVYKGRLESTNQGVAFKKLDRNGFQGNKEFLVEVLMLSLVFYFTIPI